MLSFHSEREQDIPGCATKRAWVTGRSEDQAACDHRTGTTERASFGGYVVDSLKISYGVE